MKNWLDKYNTPKAQNGVEGTMSGLTDVGFNYNGAWGGQFQMGGSIPGAVGFTYARTQSPAPSNGPYAKKTKASAKNGREMKYYQEGLDWKPKTISQNGGQYTVEDTLNSVVPHYKQINMSPEILNTSFNTKKIVKYQPGVSNPKMGNGFYLYSKDPSEKGFDVNRHREFVKNSEMKAVQKTPEWQEYSKNKNHSLKDKFVSLNKGGIIKDDDGYWNPDNWGSPVEINSNVITMEGVYEPLLGVSDEGDVKIMKPGKNYKFKGKKVTEFPVAKNGLKQEQKGLKNLDDLTNFTNYNTPSNWMDKYK